MTRPTLAITMGEPAGVGAEVIVKSLADPAIRSLARFVIFGLNEQLAYAADLAEIEPMWFRVQAGRPIPPQPDILVVDFDQYSILGTSIRQPSKLGGEASMQFLDEAVTEAVAGRVHAVVTAPISKESWQLAGYKFPGHTEYLAWRTKSPRYAMMFAGGPLRVVLATIHEALFDIRNKFTIGCVFNPIDLFNEALRDWFGLPRPRIAVCGLNPHASESGQFGDEEQRIITPAITMAREAGVNVDGPFPADTVFLKVVRGQYDGVVAMYHDQGLIPVKLLAFDESVNLTLGLPIVRTSVDHGTAFDIVGRNVASPGSMKAAIRMAVQIASNRSPAAKG
jgi:4-hydroxythreonine-4-phosphate dehydrogenase